MDIRALYDNISGFNLLTSSGILKSEIIQGYHQKIVDILCHVKPVLDEILVCEIPLGEELKKVLDKLGALILSTSQLMKGQQPMSSKLYTVLHIETAITKIRSYIIEISQLLVPMPESLLLSSRLGCVKSCIKKLQAVIFDPISDSIKEAIKEQIENIVPSSEHLFKIADSLSLSSNQELLMEAVALEMLKTTMVNCGENHDELEHIDPLVALVNYMHDCHIRIKQLHSIKGIPIPDDFCCPLSLELMSDPVIVASGQTYERTFIRRWLDHGFTVCPKTRQRLGHTNLIPNYTVKALIANWCESNNISIPDSIKLIALNNSTSLFTCTDSCSVAYVTPGPSQSNAHLRPSEFVGSKIELHNSPTRNKQSCSIINRRTGADLHSDSISSALHVMNGIDKSASRSKHASSEANECGLGTYHSGFGNQESEQSENRCPRNDKLLQGCTRNASTSWTASSSEDLEETGDANRDFGSPSDLTYYGSDPSGEMSQEAPASLAPVRDCGFQVRLPESHPRHQTTLPHPSERFTRRIISSSIDTKPDLSTVEAEVRRLIEELKSASVDLQKNAAHELRLLAKHNMDNRIVIANCGAVSHLINLLHSEDPTTQENSVTALLNLSINDNNKSTIVNAGAIDPLIHVLETGTAEARENSAATLYSLSVIEENKIKIGRSGAIKQLTELLQNGTPHGKRDATTALYNLSISHENKSRIVQAGAVRHLVELMDPAAGMVDKVVCVLANIARIPEGRTAIGQEGGIPFLVEMVELGSAKGKEQAAAALLCLCTSSSKYCSMVLQADAVPPLVALSRSGTARAKEKAHSLLTYFRNQRRGHGGR